MLISTEVPIASAKAARSWLLTPSIGQMVLTVPVHRKYPQAPTASALNTAGSAEDGRCR